MVKKNGFVFSSGKQVLLFSSTQEFLCKCHITVSNSDLNKMNKGYNMINMGAAALIKFIL